MSKRKNEDLHNHNMDIKRFSVPPPNLPPNFNKPPSTSSPPPGYPPYQNTNNHQGWYPPTYPPEVTSNFGNYSNHNYNNFSYSNNTNISPPNYRNGIANNWSGGNQRSNYRGGSEGGRGGSGRYRGRGRGQRYDQSKLHNSSAGTSGWNSQGGSRSVAPPKPSPSESVSTNATDDAGDPNDEKSLQKPIVNRKAKRKSMSTKFSTKAWDRDSAIRALAVELEFSRLQKTQSLILKFPDPDLNKDIVKAFSENIEHVHFQQPSTARYCFVQLHENANIDEVHKELEQIEFGMGKVTVERKKERDEDSETGPEEIDPYTLYIGNLPTTISVSTVKEKYPTAARVDIGFAQRMKYTRYAFIRYSSVDDAIEAYKQTHNLVIESRSIIVRFRRQKGNVGLPGESKPHNPEKVTVVPPPVAPSPEVVKDIATIPIKTPVKIPIKTPIKTPVKPTLPIPLIAPLEIKQENVSAPNFKFPEPINNNTDSMLGPHQIKIEKVEQEDVDDNDVEPEDDGDDEEVQSVEVKREQVEVDDEEEEEEEDDDEDDEEEDEDEDEEETELLAEEEEEEEDEDEQEEDIDDVEDDEYTEQPDDDDDFSYLRDIRPAASVITEPMQKKELSTIKIPYKKKIENKNNFDSVFNDAVEEAMKTNKK